MESRVIPQELDWLSGAQLFYPRMAPVVGSGALTLRCLDTAALNYAVDIDSIPHATVVPAPWLCEYSLLGCGDPRVSAAAPQPHSITAAN
jgi:hypothetical protein